MTSLNRCEILAMTSRRKSLSICIGIDSFIIFKTISSGRKSKGEEVSEAMMDNFLNFAANFVVL